MFPPKKSWMGLSPLEWLFLFACAAYYAAWVFQPFNFSPDERMRFSVTRFLFEHGRLPVNEETIGQPWGYSYAHRPAMFCNMAGALFMKAASPFTSDSTALLLAARMLGVLCVTGTVYCMLRASRLLFRAPFHWLAVCLVAMLPQFAYVNSYVHNGSNIWPMYNTATLMFNQDWFKVTENAQANGTTNPMEIWTTRK